MANGIDRQNEKNYKTVSENAMILHRYKTVNIFSKSDLVCLYRLL